MLERRVLPEPLTLLVDATGPGLAVMDYFTKAAVEPPPIGVVVHWGFTTTQHSPTEWHVPKQALVTYLEVLAETRPTPRLLLGTRLPFAAEVRQEMQTFTAEQDVHTGHITYEAYREQAHDDLIFALGLCVWHGETQGDPRLPDVDLRRGLVGMRTPRRWGDALETARPRLPGRNLAGRGGPVGWLPRALGRPGALATVALDSDSYRNEHITYT